MPGESIECLGESIECQEESPECLGESIECLREAAECLGGTIPEYEPRRPIPWPSASNRSLQNPANPLRGPALFRRFPLRFLLQPSSFILFPRISPTTAGFAFPLDSFITWPLRKLMAAAFPLRKSATTFGFAAMTS